ncbi:restriction endonuclease subunit S [Salmonella enterica subsp. salamae]|nr:restriction endonuclease subunit S [Salmonella enterica subsp. salamae]EDW4020614.1 hypothetical protein [Salmonella enterica subsp. salamae]
MKYNQWTRVRIAELCELIVDCVNKTAPDVDYETPYKMIRTPNIKGGRINLTGCRYVEKETFQKWTRRATVEKGDVLLTREAPMGEVGYVDFTDTVFLGQRIMQYRADPKKLDPAYLLYSFLSPDLQYQFRRHDSTGSIVSHIRVPDCSEFEISIPALDEQRKIAGVLRNIDDKIDLNNRINAELEAMAKTLYDYWFVQFDFPDANGKPYKTSGGKMVYNATLKREIPAGWNDSILGEFIELERGVTYSKEDVRTHDHEDTIGVLRATNVTGNTVDIDDLVLIPSGKVNSSQMLRKFDILIVMSSGSKEHVGKNGVYYFEKPHAFGAFCSRIKPVSKCRYFINTFLQSKWFKSYIKNQCLGTNINNLTNAHISMCEIVCPVSDIVEQFENKMMPIYSKLALNTQENNQLVKLRDWLLPLLMNGQVTVK